MKKKYKKGGSNNTFYSQALMLKKHIDSTANKIHKVSEIWQNIKKYGISIPATINSGGGYYLHNKPTKDFYNHIHLFLDGTWNKKRENKY